MIEAHFKSGRFEPRWLLRFLKITAVILIAISLIEFMPFDTAYILALDISFYLECFVAVTIFGFTAKYFPAIVYFLQNAWQKIVLGHLE